MINFDITGADPDYKTIDKRFMVFQQNQVVDFEEPIFAGSLVLHMVTESGLTELVPTVDWTIRDSDRDINAISYAKLIDPEFEYNLIKSVFILKPFVEDYQISCEFQRFQSNYTQPGTAYGDGPPCTPGLLQEIINSLNFLRYVKDPSIDLVSLSVLDIVALDEDLTGVAQTHIITDELHTVDVPNGKAIVRPGCGSFYNYDITIKLVSNGQTLVKGTDYIVVGTNLPKTKVTYHTSGVYDYIYLLAPVVGQVTISYHAFGGEVTVPDINSIYASLVNLTEYLKSKEFLTDDTLGYATSIVQILDRIFRLEEFARHATLNGTHGLSSAFYLFPTDHEKHWYNIASLYKTEMGGENIHLKDKAIFRVKFDKLPLVFDVAIGLDLTGPEPVYTADVIGGSTSEPYTTFGNYEKLEQVAVPEFRVIWNKPNTGTPTSGVYLQLGIALKYLENETVLITDISSPACSWILDVFPGPVAVIKDDNILLPDGVSSWAHALPHCKMQHAIVVSKFGYPAWVGNINLSTPYKNSAVWETVEEPTGSIEGGIEVYNKWVELFNRPQDTPFYMDMFHIVDPRDVYIDLIRSMTLHVYDRFMDKVITTKLEMFSYEGVTFAQGFIYANDMCAIKVYIFEFESKLHLGVVPNLGDNSRIHERFDLRQILFHF